MKSDAKAPSAGPTTRQGKGPAPKLLIGLGAALLAILILGVSLANAVAPTVSVEDATEVLYTTAQVEGEVDPQGQATEWRFQYITDAQFHENVDNAVPGFEGASSGPEGTLETTAETVAGELSGLSPNRTYHLRLLAVNGDGEQDAVAANFETLAVPKPTLTTPIVSAITASSAEFEAELNPNAPEAAPVSGPGVEAAFTTTYRFSCNPGCPELEGDRTIAADNAPNPVEDDTTGLEPSQAYEVTLSAENAGGQRSATESFETEAAGLEAETIGTLGPLTDTTAHLNGVLNPHNSPLVDCRFEYGLDESYGQSIPCSSSPEGNAPSFVSADIGGFSPSTSYHFRLVADNGTGGPTAGSDRTLTTHGTPAPEGECPNEAVRRQQHSTYLPDCRAYELVSAAEKNGSSINSVGIAPSGERAIYSAPTDPLLITAASREALPGGLGRWRQSEMMPPRDQRVGGGGYAILAATPDRSKVVFKAENGVLPLQTQPQTDGLIDLEAHQTVFATFAADEKIGASSFVLSDDGERVYADLFRAFEPHDVPFDPDHVPGTQNVYDLGVQPPLLVGRLPDDSVPACGTGFSGLLTPFSTERQHVGSTDGSVLFFSSRGSAPGCGEALELYRRDVVAGTTTLISGPAISGDSDATFLRANAAGTAVVFETSARLVGEDENGHPDVYRWDQDSGNACLTCVVPDADVKPLLTSFDRGIGVSEDLSHLYFTTARALDPADGDGAASIYAWHAGAIEYVAPALTLLQLVDKPAAGAAGAGAEITPDGNAAVFSSSAATMNALSGSDNGGKRQYYRYDDRDRSLACVSCPASGPASAAVPAAMSGTEVGSSGYMQMLSDDGNRFFFRTEDTLVPRDEDHGWDLYEWHDGRAELITDGISEPGTIRQSSMLQRGISADGRDLFFTAFAPYTASAGDKSMSLFDARIGGGEAVTTPPAPCSGENCQGGASGPPSGPGAATQSFSGPGNPKPNRKHKRHRRGQRKRHSHHRANHNRRASR